MYTGEGQVLGSAFFYDFGEMVVGYATVVKTDFVSLASTDLPHVCPFAIVARRAHWDV
jgi:hypothetical protein